MQLNSHLHFSGQCEEAFKFYEKSLGARLMACFVTRPRRERRGRTCLPAGATRSCMLT